MSIPAFGWALEQGARLKLRPSDRLVLLFIADQANPEGLCRSASQQRIVKFTGLKRQTVHAATERLIEAQLIRVTAAAGMVSRYEILRPTPSNGAVVHPAKRGHTTPAKRDVVPPSKGDVVGRQNGPHHPVETGHPPRQNGTWTPSNGDTVPCTSQESFPKRRASAREAGKILSAGKQEGSKQEDAAPPPAPPATPGSDDFNAYLEAPTPTKALAAEIEQEVVHGEVLPPDATIGPQATGAFVHSLARNFQNNYPPRAPRFSHAEMIDLCQPKPTIGPAYLPDAVLRLARMQLAERAAARGLSP